MFEALFILTTLDAGTRVGRYLFQEILGNFWKPLGDTRNMAANVAASVLMVSAWGWFLIQGVHDPLGGINSLWPLFGIANQLLAVIALCLATTVLLKMHLPPQEDTAKKTSSFRLRRPVFALVTLVPLIWLLAVTMSAGWQKIYHSDPRIGFLASAKALDARLPELQKALVNAHSLTGDGASVSVAVKALAANRTLHFNNELDAAVAAFFMGLVALIALISVGLWIRLLTGNIAANLHESERVPLTDSLITESKPVHLRGIAVLGLALARELSGESDLERSQAAHLSHPCAVGALNFPVENMEGCPKTREQLYVEATSRKFDGIKRCC